MFPDKPRSIYAITWTHATIKNNRAWLDILVITEQNEAVKNWQDVSCFPKSRKETLDDIVKVNHVFGKYVFVFQNGNLEFNTWESEIYHYKSNDSGEECYTKPHPLRFF